MSCNHISGEGIRHIFQLFKPSRLIQPGKLVIDPDAGSRYAAVTVVGLANVGVIDISDVVVVVEVDQQAPVAQGEITRHTNSLLLILRAWRVQNAKILSSCVLVWLCTLLYASGLLGPRCISAQSASPLFLKTS